MNILTSLTIARRSITILPDPSRVSSDHQNCDWSKMIGDSLGTPSIGPALAQHPAFARLTVLIQPSIARLPRGRLQSISIPHSPPSCVHSAPLPVSKHNDCHFLLLVPHTSSLRTVRVPAEATSCCLVRSVIQEPALAAVGSTYLGKDLRPCAEKPPTRRGFHAKLTRQNNQTNPYVPPFL